MILSACSATGPMYQAASPPMQDQALIYIYRLPNTQFTARRIHFFLDGAEVAQLNQEGYTRLYVQAGPHILAEKWPWDAAPGVKPTQMSVNWAAGTTYYYEFNTQMTNEGRGWRLTWWLSPIDPASGSKTITAYHFQPANQAGEAP